MRATMRWAFALLAAVVVVLVLARHGAGEWDPPGPDGTGAPVAHAVPAVPAVPVGPVAPAVVHDDPLHGGTALVPVVAAQAAPAHVDTFFAGPADCSADAPACWTVHPDPDLPAPAPVPDAVLPPPPTRAVPRADRWSAALPRAPDLAELSVLRI